MGVLVTALEAIETSLKAALGDSIDVQQSPGRFSEDEFGIMHRSGKCVRVALENLPKLQVDGDGLRGAEAYFAVHIITSDIRGQDKHQAALELVEDLIGHITYSKWGREDIFRAVLPKSIEAQNQYSGEISDGQGLAIWSVAWTQTINAA